MNWAELEQADLTRILDWAEDQPWARVMSKCVQDSEWHAEGDVWTHTKMVCDELTRLDEWGDLSREDQHILIFTALFHDVAKPLTTTVDPTSGRVTSPKHAVKGEHVARKTLREIGCDLNTRESIAKLVRYHGRPAFLMERMDPVQEVVRLSQVLNNRLLYLFAIADTRGRDTESMTRPEENLHFWKLQSEEVGCYESPYKFQNEEARFVYCRSQEPNLYYVPHDEASCTVTMLCGLPGSGKDTWVNRYDPDLPAVSLDRIRNDMGVDPTDNQGKVVQEARERCRQYLRDGQSFAFNATNLLVLTRRRWIDLFADYRARIELVYLEPPWQDVLKQNRNRSDAVPEDVVRKLADKSEPPTLWEAHSLRFFDGTTESEFPLS